MEQLIDSIEKLSIDQNHFKKVLYYEVVFGEDSYATILNKVVNYTKKTHNVEQNTISFDDTTLHLNKEFHITMLYTGGKKDEKADQLIPHLDKEVEVSITRIGINDKFICLGVTMDNSIPYHGNKVMHITVAMNRALKVQAKDSYTALLEGGDNGEIIVLDDSIKVNGVIKEHLKEHFAKPSK
jgi:hypothetical protein